jgi:peroxiredoxin
VAIVNGEPITEGMLEREVAIGRVLFPLLQGIPVDDSPATLERMRSDLLSSLIDERLLVQEAQKAGIAVSDAEVEARLSDTLSRIKLSEEELVELLTAVGVTLDDLRASLRSTMLAERFVKETPPPVSTAGKSPAEAWLAKLQQEADIQILTGEEKSRTVKIGQPAPPFTLRSPDGEVIRLKDFVGQPLLINFWATWCPPCRFEMPLLQDTYEKYRDQGLVVLGVDVQEGPELVKPFLEQYGLTFPVALDRSGAVSSAYRVMGLPTTVFVDRDGVVVDIHRGALIEQTLQGYLDKILTP